MMHCQAKVQKQQKIEGPPVSRLKTKKTSSPPPLFTDTASSQSPSVNILSGILSASSGSGGCSCL